MLKGNVRPVTLYVIQALFLPKLGEIFKIQSRTLNCNFQKVFRLLKYKYVENLLVLVRQKFRAMCRSSNMSQQQFTLIEKYDKHNQLKVSDILTAQP